LITKKKPIIVIKVKAHGSIAGRRGAILNTFDDIIRDPVILKSIYFPPKQYFFLRNIKKKLKNKFFSMFISLEGFSLF
jgi:hypothetical protein